MKILFIDINKKGIRIPFTQKQIPLPLALTAVISFFGLPSASAAPIECRMPKGNFKDSCTDIVVKRYLSSDPLVPATCHLKALCATEFAGLSPVQNEAFFPADFDLEEVCNQNGTLTHGGKPLSGGVIEEDMNSDEHCLPPLGSYHETCETSKAPYVSTDPKLANTDLCKVNARCESLEMTQTSSMIYFNIKSQSLWQAAQRIENCDGTLVSGENDKRCQGKSVHDIRDTADRNGRRSVVKL